MRTVASCLGHAGVSMTLDIYADVGPVETNTGELTSTVGQLRVMLAEARPREVGRESA